MIEITGGSATVEEHFTAFRSAMTDLFRDLSSAERATMIGVLARIEQKIGGTEITDR